jgi:hypothetical protein
MKNFQKEILMNEAIRECPLEIKGVKEHFACFLESKCLNKVSYWDRYLWIFHKSKTGSLDNFLNKTHPAFWIQEITTKEAIEIDADFYNRLSDLTIAWINYLKNLEDEVIND